MGRDSNRNCLNCSYLLYSDTAASGYRCGMTYFMLPPLERRVGRMDSYPEIQSTDNCESWKSQGSGLD